MTHRGRWLWLGLIVLGTADPVSAQSAPPVRRLPGPVRAAANAITRDQLARDLAILAQDAWNGRASLSPGLDSAASFIIQRLTRAGLKPLGDSGTFRQYYSVREGETDRAGHYLEFGNTRYRGADLLVLGYGGAWTAEGPVVYVGHGHRYPKGGIDPYAGVNVRGRIVLAHSAVPLPGFGWEFPPDVQPSMLAALEQGAAGVIYLPSAPLLARWNQMAQNPARFRELDPPVPSAYAFRRQQSVAVRAELADSLLAGTGHTAATLMARAEREDYPASFELPAGRTVTIQVPAGAERTHRGYNVVALLEGSDPVLRNEYVTVAAHLDGAVGRAPAGSDTVWNAADDNASGSAAILRIAEELARAPRPRRSIVFIWDSGEEVGLWGTRSFVGRPVLPLDRIITHFNVDMIGATRAPGMPDSAEAEVMGPNEVMMIGPRVLSTGLDSLLEQTNREYLNMRLNREHDRADSEFFYPRTDAGPFLERGIPIVEFFTGIHRRYHLPSDEAQYLDPVKMEAVARTVLAGLWMVADLPERPRLDKGIPASVPRHR